MSFWFIPILVSLALIPVFWFSISYIYKKYYLSDPYGDNFLTLRLVELHVRQTQTFDFSPGLMGVKYHLIIKFIIFLVCSLITHFANIIWLSALILSIELCIHFFTYNARKREYKNEICLDKEKASSLRPIYLSYTLVSVYQIIVYISNFAVYLLTN